MVLVQWRPCARWLTGCTCDANRSNLVPAATRRMPHPQVAMMHVVLGVVCVLLASWRIRSWRRMCSDDDEHVRR